MYKRQVLSSGLVPADDPRMESLERRLTTLDPEGILASSWLPPYEDMTLEFAAFQREFFRGLLLVNLGRISEARAIIEDMASHDEFVGLGSIKADAQTILEAEILLRDGDRRGALDALRSVEYQAPHSVTVLPLADQPRTRLVRAELERELGDPDVAMGFLDGLDQSWSPWDAMYRGQVYRLMGLLAEDAGRTEEAIRHYTRLLDLWRDCDPELVPIRDEIEARRNSLVRATG
mgnify:FL=1